MLPNELMHSAVSVSVVTVVVADGEIMWTIAVQCVTIISETLHDTSDIGCTFRHACRMLKIVLQTA